MAAGYACVRGCPRWRVRHTHAKMTPGAAGDASAQGARWATMRLPEPTHTIFQTRSSCAHHGVSIQRDSSARARAREPLRQAAGASHRGLHLAVEGDGELDLIRELGRRLPGTRAVRAAQHLSRAQPAGAARRLPAQPARARPRPPVPARVADSRQIARPCKPARSGARQTRRTGAAPAGIVRAGAPPLSPPRRARS